MIICIAYLPLIYLSIIYISTSIIYIDNIYIYLSIFNNYIYLSLLEIAAYVDTDSTGFETIFSYDTTYGQVNTTHARGGFRPFLGGQIAIMKRLFINIDCP